MQNKDSKEFLTSRRHFLKATGAAGATVVVANAVYAADGDVDTLDKIKTAGVFNIGIREAAPPYGFKNASGEYVGFATDIAKAIYKAVNDELGGSIKVAYVPVTSQTRIPLLQNGTIDLEAGATVMTIGRSKVVDFSIPHFVTATSVLVPVGSSIKQASDIAGKRIGTPQGGLETAMFQAANNANKFSSPVRTIGFPDHTQGATALQTGTIDGYSTDEPILYDIAGDRSKYRVVPLNMNAASQTLLMRPGKSSFKRIVDQTIAKLSASGEWETLYDRYFGQTGAKIPLSDAGKALMQMNSWPA